MTREQLKEQLKYEQEAIEMMVIAYQAQAISKFMEKSELSQSSAQYIHDELKNVLLSIEDAFSPEQAERIVNRYTPLSALDQDGAGAIVFRDNTDQKNIIAIRGTDIPSNLREDLYADSSITAGILPMYQTSLIDNFIARERASVDVSVPQIWFDSELGIIASEPQIGTGRLVGEIKYIAGHSEGGPEAQTIGMRYGINAVSLNAPAVADMSIQSYLYQAARETQTTPLNTANHNIHIDTTGISIISQLHGGLEGERRLSATEGNQHSSVVALQVARIQEQILESCPKIQDRQTLVALTKEYVLNPTRGEQILKVFNEHPSATPETATELVDLERGRKFVSIGGTPAGEQWYQDALGRMQEADQQMSRQQTLSQQMQREMSRPNINQQIHKPQPEHSVRRHEAAQEPHPQPAHSVKPSAQHTHRTPSVKQQPEYVDLSTIHTLPTSAVPVTIPNNHGHGISQPSHQPNSTPTHKPVEDKSLPYKAIDWWLDLNGIKHSDAGDQMSPRQLPPHIAKLHQQATDKLGEQLNHLPADQRETAIAMMTHRAIDNKAQEIDYVYINNQGQILMSFDRDRGFDYRMNLSQVAQNNVADMLQQTVALQASFDMAQQQRMMQEQNQSQGMTMAHRISPPNMG